MDCLFDRDIINRSVNGKIEPLEKIFLDEHLKQCEECGSYLNLLKLEKKKTGRTSLNRFLKRMKNTDSDNVEDINVVDNEIGKINDGKVEITSNSETKKLKIGKTVEPVAIRQKSMGIAEVIFRGATAGFRGVPIMAIRRNILRNIFKSKK